MRSSRAEPTSFAPSPAGRGSSPMKLGHLHMEPNDVPTRARPYLHQIAEMIDQPQAAAVDLVWRGALPPQQRTVKRSAVIGHLAEKGGDLGPNSYRSLTAGMEKAVGREFAYRKRKVCRALCVDAGRLRVLRHERSHHTQVAGTERQLVGLGRGSRKLAVERSRGKAGSQIRIARSAFAAVRDERVGVLRV